MCLGLGEQAHLWVCCALFLVWLVDKTVAELDVYIKTNAGRHLRNIDWGQDQLQGEQDLSTYA